MSLPIPELTAVFIIAFARIGTLVMLLPAIGDRTVPPTLRLAFAFVLTLLMLPLVRPLLPVRSLALGGVGVLLGEVLVALVIGLAIRILVAALQIAGTVVAQALGLSYATTVDPNYGGQDPSIGNFLNLLGLTLIFTTDIHHLLLAAIRDSYVLLPPLGAPESGDALKLGLEATEHGFSLAVRISAPFVAFGILFNLGLGILSRLIPQMQVFFVGMPLSVIVGMLILIVVVALMMQRFLAEIGAFLNAIGVR